MRRFRTIAGALCFAALSACGPTHSPSPSEPSLEPIAETPAQADADVARARIEGLQLAASGEARAPVEAETASVTGAATLIELLPDAPRAARGGGSAFVLLADPASPVGANKNLALCQALFRNTEAPANARPLYWLTRSVADAALLNDDQCTARLQSYDYARAERLAGKFGLMGQGPFLIAERHDMLDQVRTATLVDLGRTPPNQIAAALRYFRTELLPSQTLWAPESYDAEAARARISIYLDDPQQTDLPFAPRLLRATRRSSCLLTDLTDRCGVPG